jgi:ribonuclease HI
MKGSSWQVINGTDINIWKDNWLPPPFEGPIVPSVPILQDTPTMVCSLIDWDRNVWDLSHINQFIDQDVCKHIRMIPFGDGSGSDRLVWPWNTNGVYSVKSGYHWHHSRKFKAIPNNNHHSHQVSTLFWKLIWSMNTIPKIRNFFWRAVSKATSTLLNLYRRRLAASPMCPLCSSYEESMEHILLLCPWVELVWFGSPLGLEIDKGKVTTLDKWVLDLLATISSKSERKRLITMVGFFCWAIWKARCSFIYQGVEVSPTKTITMALSLMSEFLSVRSGQQTCSVVNTGRNYWNPPPIDYIKVNCDAAWNSTTCRAGLGSVIRDSSSSLLGGLARPTSCGSALIAESKAILEGVKLAKDLEVRKLVVETDSKVIIDNLRNPSTSEDWRICPIIRSIRKLSSSFSDIRWEWIPREANRAAHIAASLAIGAVGLSRWATQPPLPLVRVLRNDGLPCPPNANCFAFALCFGFFLLCPDPCGLGGIFVLFIISCN